MSLDPRKPIKDVFVVFTVGYGYQQPEIEGVYRTRARATAARRAANIRKDQIPGSIGAYRVERKRLQPEAL